MTKAKISEYSATAGDNTDVNGVNIAEGCPPSSMNNMGREIMAALKRYQVGSDGDGVTVGGNFVVSGTTALSTALPVASGGTGLATLTANNVVVGNGTSTPLFVAPGTSGNVLTSDGTTWTSAAGGGSPGGSDTQVQFNNAGAFGGISGVTTDGTRMTASTTIGVGGATPSTSGSGISFPASASASSNANTLDDYEEGTWTFGISFGGGTTGITFSSSAGSYTKIGQMVTIRGYMELTNKGSSSGTALITGLPFTVISSDNNHTSCALSTKNVSFADWPMAWAQPATTTVQLHESTNAGAQSVLDNTNFANNSWVMISCSYYTS